MVAKEEFDLRVGQMLAARTYADLAALTADLPAGLAAAKPPQPAPAQDGAAIPRPGIVLTVATVPYAGGIWALFLSGDGQGAKCAGRYSYRVLERRWFMTNLCCYLHRRHSGIAPRLHLGRLGSFRCVGWRSGSACRFPERVGPLAASRLLLGRVGR